MMVPVPPGARSLDMDEPASITTLRNTPGVSLQLTHSDAIRFCAKHPSYRLSFLTDASTARDAWLYVCTNADGHRILYQSLGERQNLHLSEYLGHTYDRATIQVHPFVCLRTTVATREESLLARASLDTDINLAREYFETEGKPIAAVVNADGYVSAQDTWLVSSYVVWPGWIYSCDLERMGRALVEEAEAMGAALTDTFDSAVYTRMACLTINQTRAIEHNVKCVVAQGRASDAVLRVFEAEQANQVEVPRTETVEEELAKRRRADERPVILRELLELAECFRPSTTYKHTNNDWWRVTVSLASCVGQHCTYAEALSVLHAVSSTSPRYDPATVEAQFQRAYDTQRGTLGVATYFHLARTANQHLYNTVRAKHVAPRTFTHKALADSYFLLSGWRHKHCGKEWYTLGSDGRWVVDNTAHKSLMLNAISEDLETLISLGCDVDNKEVQRALKNVGNTSTLNGVLTMLEGLCFDAEFTMSVDQAQHLLALENGVLDLRSWTFRPLEPEDIITRSVGYPWKETVPPERTAWVDHFFREVFIDPAIRHYALLKYAGLLYGQDYAQALTFCVGSGANGKNILLLLMMLTLGGDYSQGGYCRVIPKKVMGEEVRPGMAYPELCVPGARLLAIDEVSAGDMWRLAIVKMLTGGGKLTLRNLFKESISFLPKWKIFVLSQGHPQMEDADFALNRRLDHIPYQTEFRFADDPDPHKRFNQANPRHRLRSNAGYAEEDLKPNRLAVLHYLKPYLREWLDRQGNIPQPEAVVDLNRAYINELDPLSVFLQERCVIDTQMGRQGGYLFRFPLATAYAVFLESAERTPEQYPKERFRQKMIAAGCTMDRFPGTGDMALGALRIKEPSGIRFIDPRPVRLQLHARATAAHENGGGGPACGAEGERRDPWDNNVVFDD